MARQYLPAVILLMGMAACSHSSGQAAKVTSTPRPSAVVVTPPPTPTRFAAPLYDSSCEQTAVSQLDLDDCAAGELAQVEQRLPAVLRLARSTYGAGLADEDERRWLAYRQAHCAMRSSAYDGGSIQPMMVSQCKTTLTVERITDLQRDLDDDRPH